MIDKILQGINSIQQLADAGGVGLGQIASDTEAKLHQPMFGGASGLDALSRLRLISNHIVKQDVAGVDFTIPPDITAAMMIASARTDRTGSTGDTISVVFNGDTGSNYDAIIANIASSGLTPLTISGQANMWTFPGTATDADANRFGTGVMFWPDIRGNEYKMVLTLGSFIPTATVTTFGVRIIAGLWRNTAPVKHLRMVSNTANNILANSRFTLWGLK